MLSGGERRRGDLGWVRAGGEGVSSAVARERGRCVEARVGEPGRSGRRRAEPLALCVFLVGPRSFCARGKCSEDPAFYTFTRFPEFLATRKCLHSFKKVDTFLCFSKKKTLLSALYMMVRCTKTEIKLSFRFAIILARL